MRARRPLRAILWDVYGTLLDSSEPEPLEHMRGAGVPALNELLPLLEWTPRVPDAANRVQAAFQRAAASMKAGRARGGNRPEIDVRDAWRHALTKAVRAGWVRRGGGEVERLAMLYELRTNPTRPAVGAQAVVAELAARGVRMGIVSNAQFYTVELLMSWFPTAHGGPFWDADLAVWSWQCGWAKPSPNFFHLAVERVLARGWTPGHVVVVGDRLDNDVLPALRAGFCAFWVARGESKCLPLGFSAMETRFGCGRSLESLRHWLARMYRC